MVRGGGWQPSQVDLQTGSSNPSQPTAVLARLTNRLFKSLTAHSGPCQTYRQVVQIPHSPQRSLPDLQTGCSNPSQPTAVLARLTDRLFKSLTAHSGPCQTYRQVVQIAHSPQRSLPDLQTGCSNRSQPTAVLARLTDRLFKSLTAHSGPCQTYRQVVQIPHSPQRSLPDLQTGCSNPSQPTAVLARLTDRLFKSLTAHSGPCQTYRQVVQIAHSPQRSLPDLQTGCSNRSQPTAVLARLTDRLFKSLTAHSGPCQTYRQVVQIAHSPQRSLPDLQTGCSNRSQPTAVLARLTDRLFKSLTAHSGPCQTYRQVVQIAHSPQRSLPDLQTGCSNRSQPTAVLARLTDRLFKSLTAHSGPCQTYRQVVQIPHSPQRSLPDLQTGSSNPSQPTAVLARLTDRSFKSPIAHSGPCQTCTQVVQIPHTSQRSLPDLQTGSSNPSQPTAVLARLTDR